MPERAGGSPLNGPDDLILAARPVPSQVTLPPQDVTSRRMNSTDPAVAATAKKSSVPTREWT